MKEIAIILLIVIGVYLYRRTQKAAQAEKEQAAKQSEEAQDVPETQIKDITPETTEDVSTPTVDGVSFEPKLDHEKEMVKTAVQPEPEPEPEVKPEVVAKAAPVVEPQPVIESQPEVQPKLVAEPEAEAELEPKQESKQEPKAETVNLSWASSKLTKAVSELEQASDAPAQHLAISTAIAECYKQRKQSEYVQYGATLSQSYLEVFAAYVKGLKAENPDAEVKGTAMMHLSTLLNDNGEFDAAISICKTAIEYGLTDGTVTGFEGRITRIDKAKAKASK
ncbi:hypothetical protein L2719_13640 [Shewanella schlegeliana]|uniref:Tetratricopeptide repeat protein n=1 Tax=Shewanella schlegeliana TaxID=190308 RepID=A0ABS1T2H3_9GAMM|nr:hypothetical protein [Shewanella schlegeliana]MBL4914998.1 hypothetical protein [Shewanella schlegeliana]MCL1110590.1 hypothetical protein [Shewanella schlegeliana]GIU32192.1 hypothetical protein TUM4433_24830 [Shewanella schlegeliana]